jgi:hypothetical protein
MAEYYGEKRMSTYGFNYSDGDRHIAYSFKVPEEATPSDVHEQFAYFLNAIYGWDVRKHLYENITP